MSAPKAGGKTPKSRVLSYLQRHDIESVAAAIEAVGHRPTVEAPQQEKRDYAQELSSALAVMIANRLRRVRGFETITPDARGRGQESRARTGKGYKKLDVNYSTPELGLGLGLSIKTVPTKDKRTGNYRHNFSRIDNELRAEAHDYHDRQPYAVLIGLLFLPVDACDDAVKAPSSFAKAVRDFRARNQRGPSERALPDRLEAVFIGLYDPETGDCFYFDVRNDPPREGRPAVAHRLNLDELIAAVVGTYDARNSPEFLWGEPELEE